MFGSPHAVARAPLAGSLRRRAVRAALLPTLLLGLGGEARAQDAGTGDANDARHVNADESLTVRGHHSRFHPPPGPHYDPKFDPPGSEHALHDPNTGADITNFGSAYSASSPAPPLNQVPPNGWTGNSTKVGPR
jgi:hypothetical protein